MNPPWVELPDNPIGSAGWRMGHGERYMLRWTAWYQAHSADEKRVYQTSWLEPQDWSGFFAYVGDGTLPPCVAERLARLEEPQRPPSPDERSILDYYRTQWLIRHYMRKIEPFQVSARHPAPYLGQRDGEHLIGYYEEPDGSWWRISNPNVGGLEMLRIDAELLRDWQERLL